MVEFELSGPRVTARTIAVLEKAMGFSLPDDLAKFFIANNGGAPKPCNVRLRNGNTIEVCSFLEIAEDPIAELNNTDPLAYVNGFISYIKSECGGKYNEIEYLPLGHITYHDEMLYYSIAEEDYGHIVVRGYTEELPQKPYKAFISDSLSKLLDSFF